MKMIPCEQKSLPYKCCNLLKILLLCFVLGDVEKITAQVENQNGDRSWEEQLVTALKINNDPKNIQSAKTDLVTLFQNESTHRKHIIQELINIFNDSKSRTGTKRFAACYLGEMRAVEAIDSLAAQIALKPPGTLPGTLYEMESPWNNFPAFQALELIGSPAIPAMIRNLLENDDATVRDLSLRVIAHTDKDKDISQLRLQKALKAETGSTKQARLQAAIKALADASF